MASPRDERTRRALVIGIDTYAVKPLDGCVADAELMAQLLRDRFAFEPSNIRTLLNGDASRDAVLSELDALVDLTGPDDVAFVFYAGHGSTIEDASGDEGTGFDNTLCVCEDPRQDVLDDELAERLAALGAKTPHTVLIIDACNSGTITRDAFGGTGRFTASAKRSAAAPKAKAKPKRAREPNAPAVAAPASTDRYVLIAACRDGEIAQEASLPGDENVHHGALTYALSQELERATTGDTWRDVFERAASKVTAVHRAQHPQLAGAADREIFGLRELVPMRYVAVRDRATDSVQLAIGAVHGATAGSVFTVYAQGTKDAGDATPLGTVKITRASGMTSRATIVEEASAGAIVDGARAVETQHAYPTPPLAVQLVAAGADDDALDTLCTRLKDEPTISLVRSANAATVRVFRLAPREGVGAKDPLPMLGALTKETWAVAGRDGRLIAPVAQLASEDDVVALLRKRADYVGALAIDNVDPASQVRGKVTLEILRKEAGGTWNPLQTDEAAGLPVVDSGDVLEFRITSALEEPVYVSLLDFEPNGAVSPLIKGNPIKLEPGIAFDASKAGKGRGFRMAWDGDDAVESFKLFATVQPVDFSFLLRAGEATRGATEEEPLSQDDWTSVVQSIVIRRKVDLSADGRSVAVDGAALTARGLTGTVRAFGGPAQRAAAAPAPSDALTRAIEESGLATQQTFVVTDAVSTADGTRGAEGEPVIELQVTDPGEGFEQVVLATDAAGVVSWHFAPQLDPAPATRGDEPPGPRTRTFTIPAGAASPDAPATRGLASAIGEKFIKVYVFPAAKAFVGKLTAQYGEQIELKKTPYRVRTFLPDDYASPDAQELGQAEWESLGRGRALLMIHGTNSRTHTAFGQLPRAFVEGMHALYEGRVFAFDHPTLTHDPRQNIEEFVRRVPDGLALDVDIICHSRGGLVSRILAEQHASFALGRRTMRVGKVVFVGTPNNGTRLADEACISEYIDTATNLLNVFPTNGVTDAMTYLLSGVKIVACGLWSSLVGLRSMQPGGDFCTTLNAGERRMDTQYFALASNYTPLHPTLARLAADRLVDKVFKGVGNDMVVPTLGVFEENGSPYFPITAQVTFDASDGIPHTGFFQYPRTTEQLTKWLAT